jgi:hypothetical protein
MNCRSDSTIVESRTTSLALLLIQKSNLVEILSTIYLVTKLTGGVFAAAAGTSRGTNCRETAARRTRRWNVLSLTRWRAALPSDPAQSTPSLSNFILRLRR